MIRPKDMENICTLMELYMKVSGIMINKMEKEKKHDLMDLCLKGILSMQKKKGKESCCSLMGQNHWVKI